MMLEQLSRWIGSLAIAAGCFHVFPAHSPADDFPLPAVAEGLQPTERQKLQDFAQQKANENWINLRLHFDEIDRACVLTNEQRTRLNVAAKGAVQHRVEQWIEQSTGQLSRLRAALKQNGAQDAARRAAAAPAADGFEVRVAPLYAGGRRTQIFAPSGLGNYDHLTWAQRSDTTVTGLIWILAAADGKPIEAFLAPVGSAETDDIWINALAHTLTDEQRRALAAVHEARLAYLRKSQTVPAIAELDRSLRLDEHQRQKLQEVIDGAFDREPLQSLLKRSNFTADRLPQAVASAIPAEQLKDVLSESQRTKWSDLASHPAPSARSGVTIGPTPRIREKPLQ